MKQSGFSKAGLLFVVCALVLVGWLGHTVVRKKAAQVVHHHAVAAKQAQQAAKVDAAKELQAKLVAAWQQTLAAAPPDGNVDIAVYDSKTGATAQYTNAPAGTVFITASIAKLSILETLLWQNQKNGIAGLTSTQLANARPMIENSDNDAATALWDSVGGHSAVASYYQAIGMTVSTPGSADLWGLTQTTAADQLKVVNQVAYPSVLTQTSAQAADNLLDNVETDQRWGVSGGVPAGVTVRLKNGWLADNGWNVNSIGHVQGNGVDYTIAVLTNNNTTERHGIDTIQALSAASWNTVSTQKS